MILSVKAGNGKYPVVIEKDGLEKAASYFDLARKCLIVTDENIPSEYVEALSSQILQPYVYTLTPGEESKTLQSLEKIVSFMLEKGFDRSSAVVALGGGVVGDLAGFVSSVFLRGIDFYNIPTTVLSQVDSSIGGKVAVNFQGLKNMVGAFYPPRGVLVDSSLLKSLDKRQVNAGLAEAVKMALTFDKDLFSLFEKKDPYENLQEIIEKSLMIKKSVVEEDEKEAGLRSVLNFGHTLGHAIENRSFFKGEALFHGECVALGMIYMSGPDVRERLVPVLEKLSLPTKLPFAVEEILQAIKNDKKKSGDKIRLVRVEKIGSYEMKEETFSDFFEELKESV